MEVYEDVFQYCNDIPWTIVPADQNWYKEYVIIKTLTEALSSLNMQYPAFKEKIA
jgi:polyphosphate kinase 2 (PPK2 family)